jgi:glucosamine-6-phosphate deaminase
VLLSEATRAQNAEAFGGQLLAVPERAITLGIADILAADELLLVVTGANKSAVLRRLLEEPTQEALPASWLQNHPNCLVLADRAAANF